MCSEAHQRDPRNANVLRDRAEAYILNQDYEKGDTVFSMNATQLNSSHAYVLLCHEPIVTIDTASISELHTQYQKIFIDNWWLK